MSRPRARLPVVSPQERADNRVRKLTKQPISMSPYMREYVLQEIASGRSITRICDEEDMPTPMAVLKLVMYDDEFAKHFQRACDVRAEIWAEQIIELADDRSSEFMDVVDAEGNVTKVPNPKASLVLDRQTLMINTRWKYLSKIMPRKYGDTSLLKIADSEGGKLQPLTFTIVPRGPLPEGAALPSVTTEAEILPGDPEQV